VGLQLWQTVRPRIYIIGGPGSGKTFMAAKTAARFGIPAYDLDDLFWDSAAARYGVRAGASERDRKLAAIIASDGWIIEGVYRQRPTPSFEAANVIVALTPSIWLRHRRVVRRFLSRKFGRTPSKRESLADLWRLLRWSHAYGGDNLARTRQLTAECGCELTVCRTAGELLAAIESGGNPRHPF